MITVDPGTSQSWWSRRLPALAGRSVVRAASSVVGYSHARRPPCVGGTAELAAGAG
jgi:hypothetical protein